MAAHSHQHSHVRDRQGCAIRRARETSPMLTLPRSERPGQRIKPRCCTQGRGSHRFGFLAIGLVVEHIPLPTRARRAGAGVDLSASHRTSSRTSQTRLSSPNRASSPPTRKRLGASPTSHLGMSGPCEATDLQASAGVVQGADGALGGTPHRLGGWSHSARSGRAIQAEMQ